MNFLISNVDAWLEKLGYCLPGFTNGLITGIFLAVVLYALIKILIFINRCGSNKCEGVVSKSEAGELIISSVAISDLVKSVEDEFAGITILKTVLFRKKQDYSIRLIADLESNNINFPNLVIKIRNKILQCLSENLGVSCIQQIDIHLKRVKTSK